MIGVLGGSFDPVHNGHLRAALEVQQRLDLQKILFIPCQQHAFGKVLQTSAEQRLQMLKLATNDTESFIVDSRELHRPGISYTIDTLVELTTENPTENYSVILGMDALRTLPTWHQWEKILSLANIIAINRISSDQVLTKELTNLPFSKYLCHNQSEFMRTRSGKIFLLTAPLLEISATYIREEIARVRSIRYLVPDAVANYIAKNQLYT